MLSFRNIQADPFAALLNDVPDPYGFGEPKGEAGVEVRTGNEHRDRMAMLRAGMSDEEYSDYDDGGHPTGGGGGRGSPLQVRHS